MARRRHHQDLLQRACARAEVQRRLEVAGKDLKHLNTPEEKRNFIEGEIKQTRLRKIYGDQDRADTEKDTFYRDKTDAFCSKVIKEAANILMRGVQGERSV